MYPHKNLSLVWGDDEDPSLFTPEDDPTVKPLKWADTPASVRRRALASVEERFRALTEEYMRQMTTERAARRDARDRAFMKDIIAEIPENHTRLNGA
jgi:hypothetical protein